MPPPRVGVVIVTMGTRPRELAALLASVARQDVPATRVVLVGNATPLTDVPDDAWGLPLTKLPLTENLGCPGGRNVGLALLRDSDAVDVAVELDDDGLLMTARLRSPSALRAWWGGFFEGLRTPCGPRGPVAWRTVWRMTRLGRPPVV
ncbi:glycosyltransferase family 2 protein [Streptomyces albidoflavus]